MGTMGWVLLILLWWGGGPVAGAVPNAGTARLVGQVVDETGKPVPGVQVQLGTLSTQTDASGTYTLEKLRSAHWEITLQHPQYRPLQAKVWLQEGLTAALDATLVTPVQPQPQTKVGLVGVGSLPKTDLLAQRFAEDLVRLKGFPAVEPLIFLPRAAVLPVVEVLGRPLAEILDRDRQDPQLVAEFFRYLGVKALVVTRTDALIQPESTTNQTQLKFWSRVELWQFRADTLEIRYLAVERTEEKADQQLNEAEANAILQIQTTKLANLISQRWQGEQSPWLAFLGNTKPEPTPRQVNTTRVEIQP
ncbi:carboxypeptidase-like regulatory domain-containing protein [Candidatus Cyanaurora vandensis]|uniref:carboxypeptidase-like regulatory domain-containing protein n=1 Tax=Candidatus Cyanaurora vandensis TaxID=2714958 RepID=UPI00257F4B31|nr:carboxypeptidase-like regulatory domain-containing protein [Candidatus Cyanaurora vandensis]